MLGNGLVTTTLITARCHYEYERMAGRASRRPRRKRKACRAKTRLKKQARRKENKMYKANVEGTYDIDFESLEKLAIAMKRFNNPPFLLKYDFSFFQKGTEVESSAHLFRRAENKDKALTRFVLTQDYEVLNYVKMKGSRFAGYWRQVVLSPQDAETLRKLLAA